jgi:hypothetical protein
MRKPVSGAHSVDESEAVLVAAVLLLSASEPLANRPCREATARRRVLLPSPRRRVVKDDPAGRLEHRVDANTGSAVEPIGGGHWMR